MWRRFLERGGAWVLAQLVLMPTVWALGWWFPGEPKGELLRRLALVLIVLGGVVGLVGIWVLRGNRTIFPRPRDGGRLVTSGVYGWVRHPLYTSLALLSAGWSAWCVSWPALVAGVALTVLLDRKARREEAWLRERFPEYGDYARRVRRLLPWIY